MRKSQEVPITEADVNSLLGELENFRILLERGNYFQQDLGSKGRVQGSNPTVRVLDLILNGDIPEEVVFERYDVDYLETTKKLTVSQETKRIGALITLLQKSKRGELKVALVFKKPDSSQPPLDPQP
ncbi:hypothetical protein K9N08_01275 [Candidatus Gracilibacteria bacterium]|nr:hypothetical protein [Candidatus Gracilibacteria bacterium]MCF7856173.1 hypothetical protein [Candidatus Gracilibacteria bacterium]MCF7896639.1 hypothetical protein [Candidatus Gracilibacteria bacterium]